MGGGGESGLKLCFQDGRKCDNANKSEQGEGVVLLKKASEEEVG